MTEREKLDQKVYDAAKAKQALEYQIRDEKRAAEQAVTAKHAAQLKSLSDALRDAERAVRDHIDATASHPLDGHRVFRIAPLYRRWSQQKIGEERQEGIVEVVRQGSKFPESMTWRRPPLGKVIIRKLKKDGTPAKTFWEHTSVEDWTLSPLPKEGI